MLTGGYFCISGGGTPGGLYGCDLWISVEILYLAKLCISPKHCTVVCAEFRDLLVAIRAPFFAVDVLVSHALNSKHPLSDREACWKRRRQIVNSRHDPSVPLIGLFDANARVGGVTSAHVGGWKAQLQDDSGALLHSFLTDYQLALPSTFQSTSSGTRSCTWYSDKGAGSRGDYILVPLGLLQGATKARVLEDFEMNNKKQDHFGVGLRLVAPDTEGEVYKSRRAFVADIAKLGDAVADADFCRMVEPLQYFPWRVHAQDQAIISQVVIMNALAAAFPKSPPRPRREFVSDTAWGIMVARKESRAVINKAHLRISETSASVIVCAWRLEARKRPKCSITWYGRSLNLAIRSCNKVLSSFERPVFLAAIHLSRSLYPLRCCLRADLRAFKEKLAIKAGVADREHDHATLFQVTKCFKAKARAPIPAIQLADGTLAKTPLQARRRWQEHFCDMLHARVTRLDQLAKSNVASQHATFAQMMCVEFSLDNAPNFFQLVDLCRSVTRNKSFGEDNIPGDVLAHFPRLISQIFISLMLKSALRIEEPIQWKGGPMVEFLKGKSKLASFKTQDFRGVLVSSSIGKRWHKHLRSKLVPWVEEYALESQCGGIAHRGVDFAAQHVRALLE